MEAAAGAINFAPLDKNDQAGFDASLRTAQTKLEVLKPWLQQFTIRLVGTSHIDMAWLGPGPKPWKSCATRFKACSTSSRVSRFQVHHVVRALTNGCRRNIPFFSQIEQRVKEGRWKIIGGMWVEPDLNMPDGESLVRQILVGKRYFQKNFAVECEKIGWNPDSFGYNWQLPQIYAKSGMGYFVTQKLLWAHEFTTFPYKLFWWQAPDGSRLLTYFPARLCGRNRRRAARH